MRSIFLFVFIWIFLYGNSQDQLKNTFSAWSEIHGGTEDSGINRTESFVFVTNKPVKLKGIFYNDKEIELGVDDTLHINLHSHKAYNNQDPKNLDGTKKPDEPSLKKRFQVVKKKHVYYATIMYPYEWPKNVEYVYKKKTYTATAKKEFDKGNSEYAP